jgi:hypothetical protein
MEIFFVIISIPEKQEHWEYSEVLTPCEHLMFSWDIPSLQVILEKYENSPCTQTQCLLQHRKPRMPNETQGTLIFLKKDDHNNQFESSIKGKNMQ